MPEHGKGGAEEHRAERQDRCYLDSGEQKQALADMLIDRLDWMCFWYSVVTLGDQLRLWLNHIISE